MIREILLVVWFTAILSALTKVADQEGGVAAANAAALEEQRQAQQKVWLMGAGLVALGVVGLIVVSRDR